MNRGISIRITLDPAKTPKSLQVYKNKVKRIKATGMTPAKEKVNLYQRHSTGTPAQKRMAKKQLKLRLGLYKKKGA